MTSDHMKQNYADDYIITSILLMYIFKTKKRKHLSKVTLKFMLTVKSKFGWHVAFKEFKQNNQQYNYYNNPT